MNIEDLKKINLKDIDLNNIDINKIKAFLEEKRQSVATCAVVLVAVIILCNMYGWYQSQMAEYKTNKTDLDAKAQVIAEYEALLKDKKSFMEKLPVTLDADQISNELSDYASQNNIVFTSFTQEEKRLDGFVAKANVTLMFSFKDYKDLLGFIRTLERSPYAFRIIKSSLTAKSGRGLTAAKATPGIEAAMTILYTEMK